MKIISMAAVAAVASGMTAVIGVGLGLGGCGGSAGPAPGPVSSSPAAAGPVTPVTIDVQATRVGSSVRLDITGVGRRRPERHAMENPRNWTIAAVVDDHVLHRTVNGSVQVARHPVGRVDSGLWDITVTFTVAFAVPGHARAMTVRIEAPESEPFETTLEIAPQDSDSAAEEPAAQRKARPAAQRKARPAAQRKARPAAQRRARPAAPRRSR